LERADSIRDRLIDCGGAAPHVAIGSLNPPVTIPLVL
jgi:hypothetical protein